MTAEGDRIEFAAALFVSGESIFGALGAYAWLGERPTATVIAGETLIVAGRARRWPSPKLPIASTRSPTAGESSSRR